VLSQIFQVPITVYMADAPPVKIGEGFAGPALLLSYHRHMYALGEHYNALVPQDAGAAETAAAAE
jgi:OTU domain-containing protein 6